MTVLDVRFSDWIKNGFGVFVGHAMLLILCGLVALTITTLTLGLLAGPMLAGMALIVLNLLDKRLAPPTVNDLFKGFDYFFATLPITLGFYVLALVRYMLLLIPGPSYLINAMISSVGYSLGIFLVFHLVDRSVPPMKIAPVWWNLFVANWGPLLGFFLLSFLIGAIGVYALYIGLAVTFPIWICILGVAYLSIIKQSVEL